MDTSLSPSFTDWAAGGNFGMFDPSGEGHATFGLDPMKRTSGNDTGSLPDFFYQNLSSDTSPYDAAMNRYNQIFTPDASGRLPWGTQGIGFNDPGTAWNPERLTSVNGQNFYQTGGGADSMFSPQVREALQQQGVSDPNSLFTYDEGKGYLLPEQWYQQLAPVRQQEALAGEDFIDRGGLGKILMALASAGIGGGFAGAGEAAGEGLGASLGIDAGTFGDAALGGVGLGSAATGGAGMTLEDLLQQLGEAPNAGAAEAGAMNPALPADALGSTPDASFGGMLEKLGSGVSPQDIARLGLSNFGGVGNFLSRFALGGPQVGGTGLSISPLSILQGGIGLFQQNKTRKLAEQLARMADPQAAYRGSRAAELDSLMRDPSSVTKYPGYEAGLQAVERRMASQGYNGSGNMMAEIAKYGGDFFNQAVAMLNGLAGGNPGNAAQIRQQGDTSATQLLGESLNRIGYGLSGGPNPAGALSTLKMLMNLGA